MGQERNKDCLACNSGQYPAGWSWSLLFLCLGDLVVVYKPAKWEGNRPHIGLRKGLSGCISEQPCLADHLSSPSGGSRSHHTSHTSQDTTEQLIWMGWVGAAPRHLPRIQGSSGMAAVPKTNLETGAIITCPHTRGPCGLCCLRL